MLDFLSKLTTYSIESSTQSPQVGAAELVPAEPRVGRDSGGRGGRRSCISVPDEVTNWSCEEEDEEIQSEPFLYLQNKFAISPFFDQSRSIIYDHCV